MQSISTAEQRQIHEIVGDFFRYRLGLRGITWRPPVEPEVSPENFEICATLRDLSDHFHDSCREGIEELAARWQLQDNFNVMSLEKGFHTTMNELVKERGVKWERIVVAFTYAVETARRLPAEDPINTVYNWTVAFTGRSLMPWIRQKNGWIDVATDVPEEEPTSDYLHDIIGISAIVVGVIILGAFLIRTCY